MFAAKKEKGLGVPRAEVGKDWKDKRVGKKSAAQERVAARMGRAPLRG